MYSINNKNYTISTRTSEKKNQSRTVSARTDEKGIPNAKKLMTAGNKSLL